MRHCTLNSAAGVAACRSIPGRSRACRLCESLGQHPTCCQLPSQTLEKLSLLLQVWRHTAAFLAEVVLAGFVRVRAKGTAAGRGAMAADLAELSAALRAAAPKDAAVTGAMEGQLRLVDTWIRVSCGC